MTLADAWANGNRIVSLPSQSTVEARRVAADLPRDDPLVAHVDPGVGDAVDIWLAADGDEHGTVDIPDGWHITRTFVSQTTESVCITVERDD